MLDDYIFVGFAARPNMDIPEVRDVFISAIDQAVNWFKFNA